MDMNQPQDAERSNQDFPDDSGYPKLAKLMGDSPETAIFRRFRQLNMLHLLRLQAELHSLEDELIEVIQEDQQSDDPDRKDYSRNFFLLKRCAEQGKDFEQYELMQQIGEKLNKYNTALSAAGAVEGLATPEKRSLEFLRLWLKGAGGGEHFPLGTESTIWESESRAEYVSLGPKASNDRISSLVRGILLDTYHCFTESFKKVKKRVIKTDPASTAAEPHIREYNDEKLQAVSDGITAALASLLPTLMIQALYFVKRMLVRIGLVIVFTTIFSVIMSFYPGARKGEVFAAVAGFAAVEVVFIGTTG
ncbi:Hypothetical protein NCS54_01344200 [Fusarium falciforme]|uniref:Hypothetical protein n=1 Tax=Fusarium falciforme TaxID=195108 RepID=UPI0023011BB1|nr:Hypothetical protein NCS54_01344200 [Fusarium falciforme]WAO95799.1 Hypothetical protein NCS54_01344200 [Fusarium falciforme]